MRGNVPGRGFYTRKLQYALAGSSLDPEEMERVVADALHYDDVYLEVRGNRKDQKTVVPKEIPEHWEDFRKTDECRELRHRAQIIVGILHAVADLRYAGQAGESPAIETMPGWGELSPWEQNVARGIHQSLVALGAYYGPDSSGTPQWLRVNAPGSPQPWPKEWRMPSPKKKEVRKKQ